MTITDAKNINKESVFDKEVDIKKDTDDLIVDDVENVKDNDEEHFELLHYNYGIYHLLYYLQFLNLL